MTPVLKCPNPEKQYFLEVDTSSFALGMVLFQKDEKEQRCDIAYFSKALTPPECNYDIWDREFLAIVVALRHWRHLLIGTRDPVVILTDHANLQYYRHPQKINRQVARYINFLEDFNYQLKHIPGVQNHMDALSCRPNHNDGSKDNNQITVLPDEIFINVLSVTTLDEMIRLRQKVNEFQLKEWQKWYQLEQQEGQAWY